jgi:galactose mutarotase-like enzyme
MVHWRETKVEGQDVWIGESPQLSVCIVPSLGAKAISLCNTRTGREWLWRSGKPLGNAGYGSSFASGDESGWDEMFPCIDACEYPLAPWQGRAIPDHGEVWSLPWDVHFTGSALHCQVEGVQLPYLLEKTYSFTSGGTLRMDYSVTNISDGPFSFLWAAHPLLAVHEGMKLHVSEGMNEIEVSYSEGGRLGIFGDRQPWPLASTLGGSVDLSVTECHEGRFAEKYYFTGTVKKGYAALSDPVTGESVTFSFPVEQVPYLAVWANYGGFGGHYQLALEPATGRMDHLGEAVRRDEVAVVEAGEVYTWHLEVSLI